MGQVQLMIAHYDVYRDGGLRFDALRVWFDKIPINHTTRTNLLKATPTDLSSSIRRDSRRRMSSVEQSEDGAMGPETGAAAAASKDEYTAAEREWLGLAGKQ